MKRFLLIIIDVRTIIVMNLLSLGPDLFLTFIMAFCTSLTCLTAIFAYSLASKTFGINRRADLGVIFLGRTFSTIKSKKENGELVKNLVVSITYKLENNSIAAVTIDSVRLPYWRYNFRATIKGPNDTLRSSNQVDFNEYGERIEPDNSESLYDFSEKNNFAHILSPGEKRFLQIYISMNTKKYSPNFLASLLKKSYLVSRFSADNKAKITKHFLTMRESLSLKEKENLVRTGYYEEGIREKIYKKFVDLNLRKYRSSNVSSGPLE